MKRKDILFTAKNGKGVSFEDLLAKIYDNSVEKQKHILDTADMVKNKIKDIQDAVMLLPMLTDLQKVSVANDDALIKMAAIIQRSEKKKDKDDHMDSFGLTDDERKSLLEQAAQMKGELPGSAK